MPDEELFVGVEKWVDEEVKNICAYEPKLLDGGTEGAMAFVDKTVQELHRRAAQMDLKVTPDLIDEVAGMAWAVIVFPMLQRTPEGRRRLRKLEEEILPASMPPDQRRLALARFAAAEARVPLREQ